MLLRHLTPPILWTTLILALSVVPGSQLPDQAFVSIDKLVHIAMYLMHVLILIIGFKKQSTFKHIRYNSKHYSLYFSLLFGLSIEFVQEIFCRERSFEWNDVIANTVGSFLGLVAFYFVYEMNWTKSAGSSS